MFSRTNPKINCKFCTQEELDYAIRVIRDCYVPNKREDMPHRHFSPGAAGDRYGDSWWSLDYALIIDGAKWINFDLATDLVENLLATQCENGRVKLYGTDKYSAIMNPSYEKGDFASIPKYFETCYRAAVMSGDKSITEKAYTLLDRSLAWYFANRQDSETKLISAIFEETFVPNTVAPEYVYAPMDTNIEVANGCKRCSELAELLGNSDKAEFYKAKEKEILAAVEKYNWNEEKGTYYPYIIPQKRHQDTLTSSTFLGFEIERPERYDSMTSLMLDDSHFNWNTYPLTTVSKKDPIFTVIEGKYCGNPCWSGSVWTLTNCAVIKALMKAGKKDLALSLAIKTLETFRGNYAEFVNPYNRDGHGVHDYGWTAGQFIQLLIEFIFGISYTAKDGISVSPMFTEEGNKMSIENLYMPDGKSYSIYIDGSQVKVKAD